MARTARISAVSPQTRLPLVQQVRRGPAYPAAPAPAGQEAAREAAGQVSLLADLRHPETRSRSDGQRQPEGLGHLGARPHLEGGPGGRPRTDGSAPLGPARNTGSAPRRRTRAGWDAQLLLQLPQGGLPGALPGLKAPARQPHFPGAARQHRASAAPAARPAPRAARPAALPPRPAGNAQRGRAERRRQFLQAPGQLFDLRVNSHPMAPRRCKKFRHGLTVLRAGATVGKGYEGPSHRRGRVHRLPRRRRFPEGRPRGGGPRQSELRKTRESPRAGPPVSAGPGRARGG